MYKYIKIGNEVQNVAIPEDYQIDIETQIMIREKVSLEDELKARRVHGDFELNINSYIESCVAEGKLKKEQAALDREKWAEYQWDEMTETRTDFIEKLEKAELL